MKTNILKLPDDAIETVTKDNWEEYFDLYMVTKGVDREGVSYCQYVWTPDVMREFITKIVADIPLQEN